MPIDRWPTANGLQAMFKAGAAQNLAMCRLIDPTAARPEAACAKFPDTPVVIDHLCRIGVSGKLNRPRSGPSEMRGTKM